MFIFHSLFLILMLLGFRLVYLHSLATDFSYHHEKNKIMIINTPYAIRSVIVLESIIKIKSSDEFY